MSKHHMYPRRKPRAAFRARFRGRREQFEKNNAFDYLIFRDPGEYKCIYHRFQENVKYININFSSCPPRPRNRAPVSGSWFTAWIHRMVGHRNRPGFSNCVSTHFWLFSKSRIKSHIFSEKVTFNVTFSRENVTFSRKM